MHEIVIAGNLVFYPWRSIFQIWFFIFGGVYFKRACKPLDACQLLHHHATPCSQEHCLRAQFINAYHYQGVYLIT